MCAGCLSALVYQHSMTPLALPCKLMIPTKGQYTALPSIHSLVARQQLVTNSVLFHRPK